MSNKREQFLLLFYKNFVVNGRELQKRNSLRETA